MNQEESEQNEVDGMKKGADSTGEVMHVKERLVICNEEVGTTSSHAGYAACYHYFILQTTLVCVHRGPHHQ